MALKASSAGTAPAGFTSGARLKLDPWDSAGLAVDEKGDAYCYLGYRKDQQPYDLPYYAVSVGLSDPNGRDSYRFVRLCDGTVFRSSFFREDGFYRILEDRSLVLPRGTESYFGVIRRGERTEDEELTRQLFGGTFEEIEAVASAVARIAGRSYNELVRLPRLTFSKTRNNSCDFSGCLILLCQITNTCVRSCGEV